MITLFDALSAGVRTYLEWKFEIVFFRNRRVVLGLGGSRWLFDL